MQLSTPLSKIIFAASLLFCWASCGEEKPATETDVTETIETVIEENTPKAPKKARLVATIDYLRMREEPGTTGGVLATFNTGDVVYFLNEISDFTTKVEIRGIKYNEPWLQVEDESGKQGWIYGGGVKFDLDKASDNLELALQNRLNGMFGKETGGMIWDYYQDYSAAKTDKAFYAAYQMGAQAQAGLNKAMGEKFPEPQKEGQKPDLSWLEEVMPASKLGSAAEGTVYYIYKNFKKMGKKAAKTSGNADDDFIALQHLLYPDDGIEYFYPAYFLQTWDYGGHSLLGDGKHNAILAAANEFRAKHPGFFEAETEEIRERLVNDIIKQNDGYWNNLDKIKKEVNDILAADYGILTVSDKAAIEAFKQQLADPEANGIEFDRRGGN